MQVVVEDLYGEGRRVFSGEPDEIRRDLYETYPILLQTAGTASSVLDLVRWLDKSQSYQAFVTGDNLFRSEGSLEHPQLKPPTRLEQLLEAAEFMSGTDTNPDYVRTQSLLHGEGDPVAVALAAHGIPLNPQNRTALLTLVGFETVPDSTPQNPLKKAFDAGHLVDEPHHLLRQRFLNLKDAHPPHVNDSHAAFHKANESEHVHINEAPDNDLGGVTQKSIHSWSDSGKGHRVLIKNHKDIYNEGDVGFSVDPSMAAWNEMASQNLYHQAGIGHLHQKVHTSFVNRPGKYGNETQAGLVIHMDKGQVAAHADHLWDRAQDHPQHSKDLQKIAVMDSLTGNHDRHFGNLLFKEDGSPLAIDHGLAFSDHRAAHMNGKETFVPLKEWGNRKDWGDTLNWFLTNKKNMYQGHQHMLDRLVNGLPYGSGEYKVALAQRNAYDQKFRRNLDLVQHSLNELVSQHGDGQDEGFSGNTSGDSSISQSAQTRKEVV